MSFENQWFEDVSPIEIVPFCGTFVHFREGSTDWSVMKGV